MACYFEWRKRSQKCNYFENSIPFKWDEGERLQKAREKWRSHNRQTKSISMINNEV